jgi:hypothetical protein
VIVFIGHFFRRASPTPMIRSPPELSVPSITAKQ